MPDERWSNADDNPQVLHSLGRLWRAEYAVFNAVARVRVRCLDIEEDAGRVAFGVPLDNAARWIWRIRADIGNLESGGQRNLD